MMDRSTKELGERIVRIEKALRRLGTSPQLARSSIEDGSVKDYTREGSLGAQFGKQFDGSHTGSSLSGPKPPTPTIPATVSAIGGVIVTWDGEYVADADHLAPVSPPMDFRRVEIHASLDPDFDYLMAESLQTCFESPRGGRLFVSLAASEETTWYFRLVARTESGGTSDASEQATGITLPGVGDLQEQVEAILVELDAVEVDLDALEVVVGAIKPQATWPRLISTYYHEVMQGAGSAQALQLSRLYAIPFVVPTACSFDDLAFEVTSFGAATAVMRCGLYSSSGGLPDALLQDAGTVATTTPNGIKTRSFTPVALSPGVLYFAAMVPQVITCSVRNRQSNSPMVLWPTSADVGGNQATYYKAGVTGALPNPFGTIAGVALGPSPALKLT